MLAHHTAGGCPLRTGDLVATGTLSGSSRPQLGCLLELTRHGAEPVELVSAEGGAASTIHRTYLEDGDEVSFYAQARSADGRVTVGFGVCAGQILPSHPSKHFSK